ncbi:alkaline phosphatase D family protein [Haloferula sp.]|uniref:alkaline phosphatase D family protein n=1 Tax=Haloferula sp. TaxID=2497595 RepID=UPI00329CB305
MFVLSAADLSLGEESRSTAASTETTIVKGGKLEAKFPSDRAYPETTITQFAYGSCNKPKRVSQAFWDVMLEKGPQLMLLLGDQHYVNSNEVSDHREAFGQLEKIAGYTRTRNTVPTFAIWDNHDYAKGYLGKHHPNAAPIEKVFLEENRVPLGDARRSRDGVYGAWIFGEKPKRVQIIMLDSHRHRDPLPGKKTFGVNKDHQKTILGAEQWEWLGEQLKREAEVRVVASSIQVLSNEHKWQRWGIFPHERERLLRMLAAASGTPIILSGDRHRGEISRLEQPDSKPICEVTASGWAQMYDDPETNRLRIKGPTAKNHYGWMIIDWKNHTIKVQLLSTRDSSVILEHVERIEP